MTGNVPQKRSDLARDRNGRHGAALAFGDEPPITRAKASLGLPGNIADLLRQGMHPISTALSVLVERRRYDLKDVLKIG